MLSLNIINRLRSIFSFNPTAHSAALMKVAWGGGLIRALDTLRIIKRIEYRVMKLRKPDANVGWYNLSAV
jgi:hypothetical protein